MKFHDRRWEKVIIHATAGRGAAGKQPNGVARPYHCACCQRRMLCTKVGIQYICYECRGGQG